MDSEDTKYVPIAIMKSAARKEAEGSSRKIISDSTAPIKGDTA